MKEIIHYAHCVKFTIGKPDKHSFTLYESREAEVETSICRVENEDEHIVRHNGKVIANEQSWRDAMAVACYELMNKSRDEACRNASRLESEINPNYERTT